MIGRMGVSYKHLGTERDRLVHWVEEDMPIELGMLTRSLDGAQKKVKTYCYDMRKQVFEYDTVVDNHHKAGYTERRQVLEGRELKAQVIGYGECTVDDIVEAYVNPELPPKEWDLSRFVDRTKKVVYWLENLKIFLQERLHNAYIIQERQMEQHLPGLMRETLGVCSFGQKSQLIEYKNGGYGMFHEMMPKMRWSLIYSMFMFQPAPQGATA